MIVGIDIDNVLVNTSESLLEYINERLGTTFMIEDVNDYYIEKLLKEQYQWIVPAAFKDSQLWKKVVPIKDAFETVEKLHEDGHEIYFVTSTEPENVRKKIKHIARNSNFSIRFVQKRTINIHKKSLLKLDILIDDYLKNLLPEERTYYSICLDYPWNRVENESDS